MRVSSWVWVSAGAAVIAVLAWATLAGDDLVFGRVSLGVGVVGVGAVVWSVVRSAVRPDTSVKRTVAPGMQGLGEVQDLYLGRTFTGPVTYGNEPEPVAELVVERTDPLDETTWKV